MTASNLANSLTRSASMCFPPALKWTNSMPAPKRFRSALTSPTARNEAVLTCTTISVRTPKSMGRVVSTQHPPRLRSSIFPGTKMPSDGRRLILASPPHLNRARRRRSSSALLRSGILIRSCAELGFFSRLRKNSTLHLTLGGAALQRCGNCIALSAALAAAVTVSDRESFFATSERHQRNKGLETEVIK